MTESDRAARDLGAVFDAHVKAEFVDRDSRRHGRNQETGCHDGPSRSFRWSAWMRADTHDGPEQMLRVRGLIHCCSSHVRRSWNSVLQRRPGHTSWHD
jgi:hypothetical protein